MAVELFQDISELQKAVSVNCSFELDTLTANAALAVEDYILPCFGQTLYDELLAAHNANTANAKQTILISKLQKALGHFALYLHMAEGAVQFSDAGIQRRESDNLKSAFKYQENNLNDSLIRKGWQWMEITLNYLDVNDADFANWTTEFKNKNRCFFINTYKEFKQTIHLKDGRYHLEMLKGVMDSIECFAILPKLGQPFYDELKDEIKNGALSADNEIILKHIQKVVAYFTKSEAIKTNLAQFTADGLVMIQKGTQEGRAWTRNPSGDFADAVVGYNDADANRHMDKLCYVLENNKTSYPTYWTWKDEQDAAATAEAEENTEECCNRNCACGNHLSCKCKKRKSEFIII